MAKITGRDRLRYVLTQLPKEMRKDLRAVVLSGAEMIADTQRRLTQSDRVREGIRVTPGDQDPTRYAALKSKKNKFPDPEMAAIISSDSFIAPFEEFGTAPHEQGGRFAGAMHPGTPARPSFYPGYRSRRKEVQRKINAAAKKAIKQGIR